LRGILKRAFPLSLTLLFLSCAPATKDYTIRYPAGLLAEHPKGFRGCYVKVEGVLKRKWPQDQFPPFSSEDPVLCDDSGCVFIHSDTVDLRRYMGKRVKILGYVEVSRFNMTYIDLTEIKVIDGH